MKPISEFLLSKHNKSLNTYKVEQDMKKEDFTEYLLSLGFHMTSTKNGFVKNKSEYMFELNGNMIIHKAGDDIHTEYVALFNEWQSTLNYIVKHEKMGVKRYNEKNKICFDKFMIEIEQ